MRNELQPGTLVAERYRIVGLLAEGGMSTVYEVRDERLPGRLVLKQMRDISTDPDIQAQVHAQFDREAQTLARLSHPCLPRVIDAFHWQGQRFLVEDLVEGRTLEAVLEERSPREAAEVVGWATQICEALQALHEQHLVYRDLKPSNVMLTPDGSIRLVDFGIVRSFALGKSRDTVVMGTPGFAAPEQYGTQQTDARSDVYSLGVLMHHLLTGYDPALQPFTLPPVRDLNPAVDEALAAVIARAVHIRAGERYESALALRDALLGREMTAEQRFTWPQAEVVRTRGAVAACGAVWLFSLWHWEIAPFSSALGVFFSPFMAWLLLSTERHQRWLKGAAVRVDTAGLTLSGPDKTSFMAWSEVDSVDQVETSLDRRQWLCVRGAQRLLRIPLGTPRVMTRVLGYAALEGADRLADIARARTGSSSRVQATATP